MRHFKSILALMAFVIVSVVGSAESRADLTGLGSITINDGLYASGDNRTNSPTQISLDVLQLKNGNFELSSLLTLSGNAENMGYVFMKVKNHFTDDDTLPGTQSAKD